MNIRKQPLRGKLPRPLYTTMLCLGVGRLCFHKGKIQHERCHIGGELSGDIQRFNRIGANSGKTIDTGVAAQLD